MLLQSTIHPGYKDQGRRLMASLVPNGLFQGVATMNLPTEWACNPLLACVQPLLFLTKCFWPKTPFLKHKNPFFPRGCLSPRPITQNYSRAGGSSGVHLGGGG